MLAFLPFLLVVVVGNLFILQLALVVQLLLLGREEGAGALGRGVDALEDGTLVLFGEPGRDADGVAEEHEVALAPLGQERVEQKRLHGGQERRVLRQEGAGQGRQGLCLEVGIELLV